jgi:hypothetical protein
VHVAAEIAGSVPQGLLLNDEVADALDQVSGFGGGGVALDDRGAARAGWADVRADRETTSANRRTRSAFSDETTSSRSLLPACALIT